MATRLGPRGPDRSTRRVYLTAIVSFVEKLSRTVVSPLSAGSTAARTQASAVDSAPAGRAPAGSIFIEYLPGSSSYSDAMYDDLILIVTASASLRVSLLYGSQHATSALR